jgi:DNA polymerase-1
MEKCAGCPFKTKCIGTRGPVDSPFVIVGESPGSRELVVGKPFVGPSGKMIDETLSALGFDSLGIEPYVINAISCYPNGKDMSLMQRATQSCSSRVRAEISAHPRKVILCLGAAASWSVTGDYTLKITQERGRVVPSDLASSGVVLAVHPAYLMRNGGGYPFWKKDLGQAVSLLRGESLGEWREPTWRVITKPSELAPLIEEYHAAPLITGDIETDQLHWYDGRILCLGISKDSGDHVDIIPESLFYSMLPAMRKLLEGGKWAWHNGMFDVTWLRAPQHKIDAHIDEDTMLMSYSMNANRGFHDLDQVAQHFIGAPRHKDMLKSYLPSKKTSYRVVPSEVLYKYAAIDVSKQHKIFAPMKEAVRADPNANKLYHNTLIPAANELVFMRLQGVKVDLEKVLANEKTYQDQADAIALRINTKYAIPHMGVSINLGSPAQVADLLYDRLELKIPGTRSTAEDTLIQIQRRYDHPIVNLLLKHRELVKARGTYVSNLIRKKDGKNFIAGHVKPDGCVYPDFKLHGTATGRLAGADPNLLNQPRGPLIRGQYVARPGKIFVEVDENQAELRSLAVCSGDPVLLEIYTKNEISIHDVTTEAFYASKKDIARGEADYHRVRGILRLDDGTDPEFVYGQAKMRGKAVNFGIVYGREAYSLAVEFDISILEALRWIETWMDTYAGAAKFIQWCRERPALAKDIVTPWGRVKRHGLVSRDKLKALENEASNFPHQSIASDIMLETVIEVSPILRSEYDAHPWNSVYDSVYYEIDQDDAKITSSIKMVQDKITEVPLRYGLDRVPFLGDAKIGYDWGGMKDWKGSIEKSLGATK